MKRRILVKTVLTAVLALLLCGTMLAEDKKDKPKKKGFDAAKLVGKWKYVSGTRQGNKVAKERLVGTVTISKDTILIPAGPDMQFTMKYTVDASKKPPTIDIEIKDGPVKEGKAAGIVTIQKGKLKICYAMLPDGKRPKKFKSTKENGAFFFVLEKMK